MDSLARSERIRQPLLELQSGRLKYAAPSRVVRVPAQRGLVDPNMSPGSRRRLMQKFASVDWEQIAQGGTPILFATLTTPPEFWDNPEGVYRAARRARDAFNVRYPDAWAFVRRERGAGGMLHYHLILGGVAFIPARWLRFVWQRSLGCERLPRVHVERVRDAGKIAQYLTKYCSKAGYEGAEMAAAVVPSSTETTAGPLGSLSLSELHSVDCSRRGKYSGTRAWAIWGNKKVPWGAIQTFEGQPARKMAAKLRRIAYGLWRGRQKVRAQRAVVDFKAPFGEFLRQSVGFTILGQPATLQRAFNWSFDSVFDSS